MIRQLTTRLPASSAQQLKARKQAPPKPSPPTQRSLDELKALPKDALPKFVTNCPVSMHYLNLLGDLPWQHFPHTRGSRGPEPMNRAAFVAAYLIKIDQGYSYMSQLRNYLAQHPALIWLLGFPLARCASSTHGFDVEGTLSCQRHFCRVLKNLAREQLAFLLDASVKLLKASLPKELAFAEAVSLDTKHILAWVKENNPKAFVSERYNKHKQLKGDPDCKLGCKKK